MKLCRFAIMWAMFLAALVAFAQAVTPELSTADRVALQSFEQRKAEAQKAYQDAMQGEAAVEKEFAATHHGFHINPQTFAVEPDAKTEGPKETK
jgi:hypothetical protein